MVCEKTTMFQRQLAEKTCEIVLSSQFVFKSECVGEYAAKMLGTIILFGAFALKVPQIFNMISTQDVRGLSPAAFYTEVPLSIVTVVYNILQGNPFTSYGESCIILVQNVILVWLLWLYMEPPVSWKTVVSVQAIFIAIFVGGFYLPADYQYVLPLSILPMLIYSRAAQIVSNYRIGSSGQLSLITALMQFAGSVARIFTTIQEVGWDLPLLSGFVISNALSGILISQIVYYSYFKKSAKKED